MFIFRGFMAFPREHRELGWEFVARQLGWALLPWLERSWFGKRWDGERRAQEGFSSTGTLNTHLSLAGEGFGCPHSTLLGSQIPPRLVRGDGFSRWLEPGVAESHNIQQELLRVTDGTGPAREQDARPALEQHPQRSWQWSSTRHGRDRCPGVTPALFYIPRNPEGSVWSLPQPLTRAPGPAAIISTKPH